MSFRRRVLLLTVTAVVAVLGVVLALRYVSGGRTPDGAPDQARPGTVVLVPGYGGGQGGLNRLAARLHEAGHSTTMLPLPGDGTGDLRVQADALDQAVRDTLDDGDGAGSVDIVGYSAGGVVVRLWLERHDGQAYARRVVSLGSPHHGARIAGAGVAFGPDACPAACQQLAPGSELLRQLNEAPPAVPWLSIWTTGDQTVQPPDSARIAGATNVPIQSVCPDARVSHAQLPTDPLVTALVLRALGAGPLEVPADCAALRVADGDHDRRSS